MATWSGRSQEKSSLRASVPRESKRSEDLYIAISIVPVWNWHDLDFVAKTDDGADKVRID